MRSTTLLLSLLFTLLLVLAPTASAQDCSKTKLCKIGCCSKDGFCGTTQDHCGTGCQSTCDYKAPPTECSATKKCATGCCSKDGFCGTTKDHCGAGCQSTCDFKLGCDANNPCKDGTCCSKFGFCGFGKDFCSPENCVSGCGAKSQCDPGTFGADYVQLKKCPLNVCCSKWGYCGATSEFCGDKKVPRPSCDVDTSNPAPMKRVVGYYEGWAARRSCQAFMPEDVPMGVYTHLNFAFASIDPKSYKVVPAQVEDVALYKRLTGLKKYDSELKVYIALGGWTFNDPGATLRTFSELAADEAKQKVFFKSLISFLNTYDFDGVDIDWEYPVDKDRGGTAADFENFPKFLKNLKAALESTSGARSGLSITLPVSFWYLQNFDIVELEKWVDFFNIMSYDLHGLWDKGNKWLGPYLNSHTNMTEITEYLDLFWRNDIKPSKITLGLAFYSRTFRASDSKCTKAQCTFDAVGEAGPCSKDDIGGTLTNAELTDQIREAGITPTLDKEAMVKIAVIDRKWITFDDEDTFKLKADAARKMCLGGVMVWAVSQDYTDKTAKIAGAVGKRASGLFDTRYSAQLQKATKYKSLKAVTITTNDVEIDEPSPKIVRDQCYWTNCGEGCGKGYKGVPRVDTDKRKGENMQDGYHCQGGTLSLFCCPESKTIPKCGWFDFFNGKCGKRGGCPAGSEKLVAPSDKQREVGSTQAACNNGKAQVACCQSEDDGGKALDTMMGYDICKWYGTLNNDCDSEAAGGDEGRGAACKLKDGDRPYALIESEWGSGATYCYNSKYKQNLFRPLCCKVSDVDLQWVNCQMEYAKPSDGGFCKGSCPSGKVRMAMEKPKVWQNCKGGGNPICCEPRFVTEANNADEVHHGYVLALENVLQNPGECKWADYGQDTSIGSNSKRAINFKADCQVALMGTMNMLGSPDVGIRQKYTNDWNLGTNQAGMYGIPASVVQSQPEGYAFSTAPSAPLKTDIAEALLNGAKDLNDMKVKPKKITWRCPTNWEWDASMDWDEDPDDGGSEDIDSDLTGLHIHFRRDIDPDAPTNVDAMSDEVPENPSKVSSSSESETPIRPRETNWLEAIDRLRRFAIRDEIKQPQSSIFSHRDAKRCKESLRCHARMLGFDLSKSEDRMAYLNTTLAQEPTKRYEEEFERRQRAKEGKTLEKRYYQMGQPRKYTVKSSRHSNWQDEIIESSEYPNGNQGDDLIELNGDSSRYVVKSTGCGPTDYELKRFAAKSEKNGIWVTEHILELNTIGRFMTASLDGGLGGLGPPSNLPGYYFGDAADEHQVKMFAFNFIAWNDHTALTPADSCLTKLGSMQERTGLVVCDSALNLMKTRVYKVETPVGDTTWLLYCIWPTATALERAMAYIQAVMAVFDYYNDVNVKGRHAYAYQDVMEEMALFEMSYEKQFGLDLYGEWQQRWKEYMTAHFSRVETNARVWAQQKLNALHTVWQAQLFTCGPSFEWCMYCAAALNLINQHWDAIDARQKMVFDYTTFDDPTED